MLIPLSQLVKKYNIQFKGVLHVGAHECEELGDYEQYIQRSKILWIEAMENKVEANKAKYEHLLIENAVISDKEETLKFNVSNNGQSSSLLELGLHKQFHPHIHYVDFFMAKTQLLKDILPKYEDIHFNFLNLDIQGAELKALKSMGDYLNNVDYIYTEVNSDYVYEDCALITELDDYLSQFNLKRVETKWCGHFRWGDAFYIKQIK
jgi:FkbM family methyltransferase